MRRRQPVTAAPARGPVLAAGCRPARATRPWPAQAAGWALALGLALAPGLARADDDEDPLKKIAEQLVEGYEWLAEDFKELTTEKKDPKAKLEYVLEKGQERAWDKGQEMIADAVKEHGPEYLRAFLRQQAFQQMAVADLPLIIRAYGGVKPEAWEKLDEKMTAQVNSRMFPVSAAFSAWKIKDDYLDPVVNAWAEGSAADGAKELAKIGLDKLGDAAIPGYGWAKLSVQIVLASGNLMVGWINDFKHTAVLEGLYPALKKSASPEERGEFARSLVQRDQGTVSREVKARYDDFCLEGANPLCIGYVDYWQQKANEEAGKNAMDGMFPEVLHDILELRRKYLAEAEKARAQADALDRATREATEAKFAPIKARAQAVKAQVARRQAKLAELRKAWEAAKLRTAGELTTKAKAKFDAQPKGGAGVQFQPVGGHELATLKQVLPANLDAAVKADPKAGAVLEAAREQDAKALSTSRQQATDQFKARREAIEKEYQAAMAAANGISDAQARGQAVQAAQARYSRRLNDEVQTPETHLRNAAYLYDQMIEREEALARDEAQARLVQQMAQLSAGLQPLQQQAEALFTQAGRSLQEIAQQLDALPSPSEFDGVISHAELLVRNSRDFSGLHADEPGVLHQKLGLGVERAQQVLQGQKPELERLAAREQAAMAELRRGAAELRARYEGLVPSSLRQVYDWNNPNAVQLDLRIKAVSGPRGQVHSPVAISQSMSVPAGDSRVQRHQAAVVRIEALQAQLEPLLRADYAASRIITLMPQALNALGAFIGLDLAAEQTAATQQLGLRDGRPDPAVPPAESDAAKTLQAMELAWQAQRGLIRTLQTHARTRSASKTLLQYWRNDPAGFAEPIQRMGELEDRIKLYRALLSGSQAGGSPAEREIKAMYQAFAQAYEGKSLSALVRFLARDWEAEDGTTRPELEQNLRNSFRVFDTVEFKLSGLTVSRQGTQYQVAYSVKLVGRVRSMKAPHEEQTTVKDTVELTPEGPRIVKTSGGRLWLR